MTLNVRQGLLVLLLALNREALHGDRRRVVKRRVRRPSVTGLTGDGGPIGLLARGTTATRPTPTPLANGATNRRQEALDLAIAERALELAQRALTDQRMPADWQPRDPSRSRLDSRHRRRG